MDSIRGEVSNKIRSAIKAKLMELGAYVDDELPDYIMVMVANKRSRQQMEDDLLLFLGDSTITFTSWLHTVLSKLQQVTINSAELKKGSDKKRISSEDHKKEKHKKMKKEKLEHTDKIAGKGKHKESTVGSNDSQLRAHIIKSEPDEVNTHENPVLINIQEENKAVSISRSRSSALDPKSTQSKTTEEEDEDDFINLKADVETDMWCESEETSAAGIKNSNAELIPQPPKKTTSLEPLIQAAVPSQVNQLPESISEKIFSNTEPSASSNIALPKSPQADQKSTSKIIKISETIRQEQETVKPASKIVRDPQALVKRVFQSHIVSQRNMKDKSERSRKRSALSHTVEDQSRRSDQRRKKSSERVDLRDTLRKERLREREHKKDRERERRRSRGENQARKSQQTMTSIARAPLSHKDENESDHGLSSIVRVKPRPQIPAALQANKSLILKAVAEAQKSVSKAAVRSELTIKSLAKASITKKSAKDRLQLPKLSIRKTEPSNKDLLLLKQRTQLPSRETLRKMSFTVRTKETPAPKELDVQDFDNVSDESSIILDPSLNILIQVPASPVREGSHESADPVQAENVRKWIEDVEEATKSEVVPPGNNADLGADQDSFEALETSSKPGTGEGIENLDDALEVETSSLKTLDNTRVVMSVDQPMHRPSIGPQFVVTLDGLDPMLLRSFAVEEGQSNNILKQRSIDSINVSTNDDKEDDSVKEQLLREELLRQQAAVREQRAVNPSNAAVSPAPVLVNMLDKSSASPGNLLELRQPKVNTSKTPNIERCKFWPTCKNKDKCEFHHPSVQCKLFPNCKFADRCLYIHPTCRFNTSCTRADCVYTHTGPKPTHITPPKGTSHLGGQSIKQACKFFPHCSNPSCPFLHPTVCKFGTHCSKPKCQYIHSEKGLNSKHKWIRH